MIVYVHLVTLTLNAHRAIWILSVYQVTLNVHQVTLTVNVHQVIVTLYVRPVTSNVHLVILTVNAHLETVTLRDRLVILSGHLVTVVSLSTYFSIKIFLVTLTNFYFCSMTLTLSDLSHDLLVLA